MTRLQLPILGLLLALTAAPGAAFQEQGGKVPAQAATPAEDPRTNMNVPSPQLRGTGTEIRIPGIGPVGTLPRFDFGLELLYGAGEPKGIREELNKSEPSDLQIRGTLKYRFPN
jgi:hypothetical protein